MNIFPIGTLIGRRFEVASLPLKGGMGLVYFCIDHKENRPVALKTFRPELLPDRTARDRFLRECTAWVELGKHPHIVRCYEVFYQDPSAYLVLELIAKEQDYQDASLRSWLIPDVPLNLEYALLFGHQIISGMLHTSEMIPGFVHRDLKPENILVGADKIPGTNINRLRVTDFGLMRAFSNYKVFASDVGVKSDTQFSSKSLGMRSGIDGIAGTPVYMAPEQWHGDVLGVWTDIYAFGCILYEMLSGHRAANGNSIDALMKAHCEGNLNPLPNSLPNEVSDIVRKCLILDYRKRAQDWKDIDSALQNAYIGIAGELPPLALADSKLSREERVQAGWSYKEIGIAYEDIGNSEVAVPYFNKAFQVGQVENDRALESAALGNLGVSYKNLGQIQQAIACYEQKLIISRNIGDKRGEGNALGNLGNVYQHLSDTEQAIKYYEENLTIAREIGDRHGEGSALGNLGSAYFQSGNVKLAVEYYQQHLKISQIIGDRRGEGIALGNLGLASAYFGDLQKAVEYHARHLSIARDIGDRIGEGSALGNLGLAYADMGDFSKAIDLHEQNLSIAREIGYRRGEGAALGNLGLAFAKWGESTRAIKIFEQQLKITREIGDKQGEGVALGNLGSAYRELGVIQHAISYYKQQLEITRSIKDKRGEGSVLSNLGVTYNDLGDEKRAARYFEQALSIALDVGDKRMAGAALSNLGNVYLKIEKLEQALHYYEQAIDIRKEIGDILGIGLDSFNLALLYAQQSHIEHAILLAQNALDIFTQVGHRAYTEQAHHLLLKLQR